AELPARRRALSILLHAAVLIVVAFILGMLVYMVLLRDTPTTGAEGAGTYPTSTAIWADGWTSPTTGE
ncbi:MAG TPA: hypothetical protein VGK35_07550, partial [Actinotalea sp.]